MTGSGKGEVKGNEEGKDGSDEEVEMEKELAVREQDRLLPIANISRIMKKALPANAKIAKDAKECVQECVSEFISFVTSEASDKCLREKRKTINGDDLLWAMSTLGFEDYMEPLKLYLFKYREQERTNQNSQKEEAAAAAPQAAGGSAPDRADGAEGGRGAPGGSGGAPGGTGGAPGGPAGAAGGAAGAAGGSAGAAGVEDVKEEGAGRPQELGGGNV